MRSTPSSTYRLQLNRQFTFDDAASVVDYLRALGFSHVYCSPYLQAVTGSTHGYDVTDHSTPSADLGGEAGFQRFVATLAEHGLGQVIDVVPNHMAIATSENRWWADVLENGPSSHFASYFDVEWEPPEARLRNSVLIPVLGDHYGRVLESGGLTIVRDRATFRLAYGEHRYPVSPNSLGQILGPAAKRIGFESLAFLADAFGALPRPTATDRSTVRRRHRDIAVLRVQLERALDEQPAAGPAIDETLAAINSDPDALHALLEMQNYRLAWWRTARRDLGYRRFFDINTLIGLRMEDEAVFRDTHQRVLEWVRNGYVDGIRVDHPDGLRDPQQYLERLRSAAPDSWIVVEKILAPGERLPATWPVDGTTGYDFLNRVAGLFVDPAAEETLTQFYAEFTGEIRSYAQHVHDRKLYIVREVLGSDVNRLADLLLQICERHRRHRDYSRDDLVDAVRELVVCCPVYRSYVRPVPAEISEDDLSQLAVATRSAIAARPDIEPVLFEFLRDIMTRVVTGDLEEEFVARFQQLTGPAMAKGVEDTAFYTYNRFIALNEVGGNPASFGLGVADFHRGACDAQARRPTAMLTTATHDTKRGEDVRARLCVLSEQPDTWCATVQHWSAMTSAYRTGEWPDHNAEYLFYQTLVGAWPISAERLVSFMEKATREAKVYTSWTSPNSAYDAAIRRFVEAAVADASFMEDVNDFVQPLIVAGRINSLAQTLIKLTAPGIPDVYQGNERWSLDLVDPDNRRPVDFDGARRALAELSHLGPSAIWSRADEGLPKVHVLHQALQLRNRRPASFDRRGSYAALYPEGPMADHVVAFVRGGDVITVVPRLGSQVEEWSSTSLTLPSGTWRNVLGAEQLLAGSLGLDVLWRQFPVALLERLD